MKKCESCTSCGMPFQGPNDHALGDESIPYCSWCTKPDGTLRPYSEVLEATSSYFIRSQGLDPIAAVNMAKNLLKQQPAWRSYSA